MLRSTILVTALTTVLSLHAGAQAISTDSVAREQFKRRLADQTDGWWLAPNARYQAEDGGIEAYGLVFRLLPGGLGATGCLWGVRGGATLGPFWHFLSGWDPVSRRGFAYQTAPSGAVGFGHSRELPDGQGEIVQAFEWPGRPAMRVRHLSRVVADTSFDRSFDEVDGRWVARRSYDWVRQRQGTPPC